jgi:hypothetical protein
MLVRNIFNKALILLICLAFPELALAHSSNDAGGFFAGLVIPCSVLIIFLQ